LDSGEVVIVSVARNVLVRLQSRPGDGLFRELLGNFFGHKLYYEDNVYKDAKACQALFEAFPHQAPGLPHFKNPVLSVFANAVMHCSSAADVCAVLNRAAEGIGA
jgi:hypothetical protein